MDVALNLFMQFRAMYILKINVVFSQYNSLQTKQICDKMYIPFNVPVIVKCMIKKNPYKITLLWLSVSIGIFGYAIKQFEVTYQHVSGFNWSYWNGFWNVVITMTTGKNHHFSKYLCLTKNSGLWRCVCTDTFR